MYYVSCIIRLFSGTNPGEVGSTKVWTSPTFSHPAQGLTSSVSYVFNHNLNQRVDLVQLFRVDNGVSDVNAQFQDLEFNNNGGTSNASGYLLLNNQLNTATVAIWRLNSSSPQNVYVKLFFFDPTHRQIFS